MLSVTIDWVWICNNQTWFTMFITTDNCKTANITWIRAVSSVIAGRCFTRPSNGGHSLPLCFQNCDLPQLTASHFSQLQIRTNPTNNWATSPPSSYSTDHTEKLSSVIARSPTAGETTNPQRCSLRTAVVLLPIYIVVTWSSSPCWWGIHLQHGQFNKLHEAQQSAWGSTICMRLNNLHEAQQFARGSTICMRLNNLHEAQQSAWGSTICTRLNNLHEAQQSAWGSTIRMRLNNLHEAQQFARGSTICMRLNNLHEVQQSAWGSTFCTRLNNLHEAQQFARGSTICMRFNNLHEAQQSRCHLGSELNMICFLTHVQLKMIWTEW
jgi:uncharacterized protein YihD (DUF1040 family)